MFSISLTFALGGILAILYTTTCVYCR